MYLENCVCLGSVILKLLSSKTLPALPERVSDAAAGVHVLKQVVGFCLFHLTAVAEDIYPSETVGAEPQQSPAQIPLTFSCTSSSSGWYHPAGRMGQILR